MGNGLPQYLFGLPPGIDVGCIEEVHTGFETEIDQRSGFIDAAVAPLREKRMIAPEGSRSKTQGGNLETGAAEGSVFHLLTP